MALTDPRVVFGIHSVALYNTTTREPYGIVKVAKGANINLAGEVIELTGGSFRYPWAIEDGLISTEISLTFAEYPDFLYEVFLGKQVTTNTSDSAGNVSTAVNVNGSSVIDGSNGISGVSATVADEADLKFGKYIIRATGANTFDVFALSDIDFARGTDLTYIDNSLKIIDDGDVSLGDYVDAETGLTFSQVGTPAFTVGDTAYFEVRPINTSNIDVTIGGVSDVFPEFGLVAYAQQRGSGSMFEVDMFRCKAIGMPISMTPQEFSEAEVTVRAFYDSNRNGIMQVRSIDSF